MLLKRSQFLALAAGALVTPLVASCGKSAAPSGPVDIDPKGEIKPREISWLLSRPANGAVIDTMQEIAGEYAEEHAGFQLTLITTPDRPSYIQKYETLAAANKLPELFDTDATPFAQKLASQNKMVNIADLLDHFGITDQYRPSALDYQRFDDGSLYMIPLEYGIEVFWYNKALFKQAGVEVPASLDDFPAACKKLADSGVTPIALDGLDGWTLERYVAYQPFRMEGEEYIKSLKKAESTFADEPGRKMAQWLHDLGSSGAFQEGFSSVGYADAQSLFTSGKAAMYNIGTWELPSLATTELSQDLQDNIGFFTLPTTAGSKTGANEYVAPSGIGVAVNASTYDPLVHDFLKFVLERYPEKYAATGLLGPTTIKPVVPDNALPIYKEAIAEAANVSGAALMPWDTQLDPTTNTKLQQEQVLLVQGDITVDEFVETMDAALTENASAYFNE